MKYYIVVFVHFVSNSSIAQDGKWTVELYVNPVMVNVGNHHVDQNGLELYEFHENKKWQREFGITCWRQGESRFNIGVGLGIKDMKYNFRTDITCPLSSASTTVIESVGGNASMLMLAPTLSMRYRASGMTASIGVEWNVPMSTSSTFQDIYGEVVSVFEPPDRLGMIIIQSPSPFESRLVQAFLIPDIKLGYEFTSALSVHVGAKLKPYGSIDLYGLRIDGFTADMPTDVQLLHSIIVYNRLIMPYIGLTYQVTTKT